MMDFCSQARCWLRWRGWALRQREGDAQQIEGVVQETFYFSFFFWYEAALRAPTSVTNSHLSGDPFKAGHLVPMLGWAVMNPGIKLLQSQKELKKQHVYSALRFFFFFFCFFVGDKSSIFVIYGKHDTWDKTAKKATCWEPAATSFKRATWTNCFSGSQFAPDFLLQYSCSDSWIETQTTAFQLPLLRHYLNEVWII